MPAEWAGHAGTWLAWPHNRRDWPGKFATIPWVYAEIVRHLAEVETVHLLVQDEMAEKKVRALLSKSKVDLSQVIFHPVPTDRIWTRDYGPTFLIDGQGGKGLLDWQFNAWAKYSNWQRDDQVTDLLFHSSKLPRWQPRLGERRIVLEGGSMEVNGDGLLLTTEECLLSAEQSRNPGLNRGDYEQVFQSFLGITKTLWLGRGIVGDDTHGHVDDLARFVSPGRVVTVVEENPDDVNYRPLKENLERLQGMTDQAGRPLEVIPLPMPGPLYFQNQRLPASYANFYIANDLVLMPTFNDPRDRRALGILADCFPDRTVRGIHAVDLVWGFGTLHCLTQQEPRGRR